MKRVLIAAMALCGATGAHAYSVFNFEEFSATSGLSGSPGALTSIASTNGGLTLTITRSGGASFDIYNNDSLNGSGSSMPLTFDHRTLDPFAHQTTNDFFVGNFNHPITAAEVEMTDFGGDSDIIEMQVWSGANGTGTMIADQTLVWGTNSSPNFGGVGWNSGGTTQANSIVFRGGGGDFFNSMYIDNIAAVQAVPEPATMAALGIGIAGMISRRRRNK